MIDMVTLSLRTQLCAVTGGGLGAVDVGFSFSSMCYLCAMHR